MIICSDLHIRRTTPRARVDDYATAQERKFKFILEQAQANPPLLIAGDFFHRPRSTPYGEFQGFMGEDPLEQWIIALLKEYKVKPICIPGQHDLPLHNIGEIKKSSLGVLAQAGVVWLEIDGGQQWDPGYFIYGCSYGIDPPSTIYKSAQEQGLIQVLLWHHMVINEPLWPGQEADKAAGLLRKYPQFDIIATGDNHQTFAIAETINVPIVSSPNKPWQQTGFTAPYTPTKDSIRWLINPGSMMRMTASQVDHRPCVFRYEDGRLDQIFLPIEDNVFDLTELEQAKEKDSRVQAFIDQLDGTVEMGLSFEKNLTEYLARNQVHQETKDLIWRCLE